MIAKRSTRERSAFSLLRHCQGQRRWISSKQILFLVWICSLAIFTLVHKLPVLASALTEASDEPGDAYEKRSAAQGGRDEGLQEIREAPATRSSPSRAPSSLLVLCTADGTLYAIDAWTGKLSSTIRTDALLVRSSSLQPADHAPMEEDSDSDDLAFSTDRENDEIGSSADSDAGDSQDDYDGVGNDDVFVDGTTNYPSGSILPGLDGNLYYWLESVADEGAGSDGDDDDLRRLRRRGGELTQLPITMEGLLERPAQTCGAADLEEDEENAFREGDEEAVDQECGILTATLDTSLLAMNERGELLWMSSSDSPVTTASQASSSPSNQQQSTGSRHTLVLQRKDYHVRQVSTTTGQQVWNVTLGTWHALDFSLDEDDYGDVPGDAFGGDDADETGPGDIKLLTDHVQDKRETLEEMRPISAREKGRNRAAVMPAIVFSTGKEILAVHPITRSVVWKLEAGSVVASVFGIHKGRWKPLDVLGEEDIVQEGTGRGSGPETASFLLDSRPSSSTSTLKQDYHELYDAPLMHWFEHYRARQMLVHASGRGDMKALPSNNEEVEMTIGADGQQMSSTLQYCAPNRLDCSSWRATQLRLPSPSSSSTPKYFHDDGIGVVAASSVNMLQPDGLLLSWRIVAVLVALSAYTVVLGRIWYLHKKQSWLSAQNGSSSEDVNLASATTLLPPSYAHSQSLEASILHLHRPSGDTTALRRTMSLPDAHLHIHNLSRDTEVHGDRSSSHHSSHTKDDGLLPLQEILSSAAPATVTKSRTSIPESTSATDEQRASTGIAGPATVAGTLVPLVQYSRYASEYEEVGPLGKGGFGSVYQCKNVLDGREYAIKKVSIRSHTGDDESRFEQRLERTLREVKILAVLDHPNIVRYFGAWLEVEKGVSDDDVDVDESTRGMSRCYSTTMVTESVSRWQPNRIRGCNGIEQETSEDSWSCSYPASPFQHDYNRRIPMDDCGFIFEESEEERQNLMTEGESRTVTQTASPLLDSSGVTPSRRSAHDGSRHAVPVARAEDRPQDLYSTVAPANTSIRSAAASLRRAARHTLYIQMQLCSQKTVGDFLVNADARQGSTSDHDSGIDIPLALRIFLQVARAVGHVHDQGLIHRDLKPQNCFMDDLGVVKVGDFGLSRESSDTKEEGIPANCNSSSMASLPMQAASGEDHTAGVGTRAYASPEQMNGSDYDSSTDVYSLGIMLFELVYPMYTGMERNICFSRLRQSLPALPTDWEASVGNTFPSLRDMLLSMVSFEPNRRPSASSVAQHIQSILSEFTIVSLDPSLILQDVILLRVEAEHQPDSLTCTIEAIEASARELGHQVQVVQYGLRSSNNVAIMEFALSYHGPGSRLVDSLGLRRSILKVRQVKASTYTGS